MIVTDVSNVEQFLAKYYRDDRYHGRGKEYAAGMIASHQKYFTDYGYDLISRHDSNMGQAVWFFDTSKPFIITYDKSLHRVVRIRQGMLMGTINPVKGFCAFQVHAKNETCAIMIARMRMRN